MYSIIVLALTSFVLSLLLTPLCRKFAMRHGLVDAPDADRKFHKKPVPRIGGVPIMLGYVVAVSLLALSPLSAAQAVAGALPFLLRLMPGLLIVFGTGLVDDLVGLKPWQKLAGEMAAAAYVCWTGVHIGSIAGYHLNEWIAVPLTIVWLVACSKAVNQIGRAHG